MTSHQPVTQLKHFPTPWVACHLASLPPPWCSCSVPVPVASSSFAPPPPHSAPMTLLSSHYSLLLEALKPPPIPVVPCLSLPQASPLSPRALIHHPLLISLGLPGGILRSLTPSKTELCVSCPLFPSTQAPPSTQLLNPLFPQHSTSNPIPTPLILLPKWFSRACLSLSIVSVCTLVPATMVSHLDNCTGLLAGLPVPPSMIYSHGGCCHRWDCSTFLV